jgi:hypothetical protein
LDGSLTTDSECLVWALGQTLFCEASIKFNAKLNLSGCL